MSATDHDAELLDAAANREIDALEAERDEAIAERDRLLASLLSLGRERDRLTREVERLRGELDEARAVLGVVMPLLTAEQVAEWTRIVKAHRAERETLREATEATE